MRAVLSPVHRGLVHGVVGGVLELAGLVLLVVAIAHRLAGERSRVALWGSVGLTVALQVQAALGWAPGALPTAIHVPLGVGIFAGAVALSGTIGRSLTTATPDRWQGGAEQARTATHT